MSGLQLPLQRGGWAKSGERFAEGWLAGGRHREGSVELGCEGDGREGVYSEEGDERRGWGWEGNCDSNI